ncbi:alpha/beta hydrolase family protein [Streptomyces sp. NPDC050485]|uniref:alpha/beta hydrolase family protein n=1 Tax=Streptomyces sp. NPDC050485 TaxID=3365617 RepID=UPI0037A5A76C
MTSQLAQIRIAVGTALLGSVLAANAPASAAEVHHPQTRGGAIVSSERVADLTPGEVTGELQGKIDSSQVRFGVTAYRVAYRTTDSAGAATTASQLVVLPKNAARRLPTVSWLHGTTVYRKDVASENPASEDRLTALLFASTGRAVSAPDYVGLGSGEGFHPYGDPGATVAASVDGLRAARAFAHQNGRELERNVQVSGFSQGGPATMMVGRALQQEGADHYFRLGALAPVSGPFHLSAFESAAADDKIDKSGIYLAYFATAWNRMYGLYGSPGEAFRAPYDQKVEGLFDGYHTTDQIVSELPPASKDLFTEAFLDKIRKPAGVLKRRLNPLDNTCNWRPDVPVQIFHSRGDKDVDYSHAEYCANQLTKNGAAPRLTNLGNFDHSGSVRQALPQVIRFFDESAKTG